MNQHRSLMTTTALSGALAITGIALTSGVASAAVTVAFPDTNFATQAATASSGVIGLNSQVLTLAFGAGDICPVNSTITLTAPAGVTFTSAPGFTAAAGAASATGFVSGASAVTYTVSTAVSSAGAQTVTIGGTTGIFTLASGTTFTTASTTPRTFTIAQSGCTIAGGITQAATGLRAASAFSYAATAGTNATIDTGATGQGKLFTATATNSTRVAVGGTATFNVDATLINTAGGGTYSPGTSTGIVTMSGVFSQLARVYLANGACNTTAGGALPSGSITGVVSGSAATFTGLQPGSTYTACFENNGSSVIQSGTYTSSASASAISGTVAGTGALGVFDYSGTATTINYVTGGSAYQYFARVTNTNNSAVSVFVVVNKDDGSTPAAGLITTNLGANANALYSMTDINTASGANLTAADRARVQVLTSGSAGTTPIQGILFNTATGVVTVAQ